jgi:hypothetical protein
VGDGITSCAKPIPEILGFAPDHGPEAGGTYITIRYRFQSSSLSKGFCRFGHFTVVGHLFTDNSSIICRSPPGRPFPHVVSLALDESDWGTADGNFSYDGPNHTSHKVGTKWSAQVCLVVLVVLLAASLVERKRRETSNSPLMFPSRKATRLDKSHRRYN